MSVFYNKITMVLVLLMALSIAFAGCNKKENMVVIDGFAQGSTYHLVLMTDDTTNIHHQIDSLLSGIDNSMSQFVPNSLVNRLNSNETDSLDGFITYCVDLCKRVSTESDGLFDITILPISEAWGFVGREYSGRPNLDSLLQYVGSDKIAIKEGRLVKADPRVRIDLQPVAQGLSADLLAQLMDRRGIRNYMVEIGGEIFARGTNNGNKWRVGVDRPMEGNYLPGEDLQVIIELEDKGIATSGNYRKYFVGEDGRKVAHIFNPKTGESVLSNLLSATVIADDAATADVYGTMLMVMGLDESIKFLQNRDDLMGYLIYTDSLGNFNIYYSDSLHKHITKNK